MALPVMGLLGGLLKIDIGAILKSVVKSKWFPYVLLVLALVLSYKYGQRIGAEQADAGWQKRLEKAEDALDREHAKDMTDLRERVRLLRGQLDDAFDRLEDETNAVILESAREDFSDLDPAAIGRLYNRSVTAANAAPD